jgi:hypothetical protein
MPNGIDGVVVIVVVVVVVAELLRPFRSSDAHRMRIGRASDSNSDARPMIRIRCAALYMYL